VQGQSLNAQQKWDSSLVYTLQTLSAAQQATFAGLSPAGGVGVVAVGFTRDFDGDGRLETVAWGEFTRGAAAGNFLLVTREGNPPQRLLVKEYNQVPVLTAFTLKPDNSLWFGGTIDAGEVRSRLDWSAAGPQVTELPLE
jgi:hypothetical protein